MTDVGRLSEALVAAQQDMPPLRKDETAEVVAKGGARFSYTYLSLQALLEAVLPVLNRHGLALIQMPGVYENRNVLWTHLRHVSGDELKSPMLLPVGPDVNAQQLGSALTYCRRYAVLAFLGLAPDDDDDGHKASGAGRPHHRGDTAPEETPKPAAKDRPPSPGTLRILKETVETLQKGYPSPDPNHSYWDDVRAYMIGEFAKSSSADLSEAQVRELILHMEKRLVEAGQAEEVPFG